MNIRIRDKIEFRISNFNLQPVNSFHTDILQSLFYSIALIAVCRIENGEKDSIAVFEELEAYLTKYADEYLLPVFTRKRIREISLSVIGIQSAGTNNLGLKYRAPGDGEIVLNLTSVNKDNVL